MARRGPGNCFQKCPFIGVKRSCEYRVRNDAIDPNRTLGKLKRAPNETI